ncbi:TM2 domain-containing protein [Paracoccus sp. (in: a-proteobacteria)]
MLPELPGTQSPVPLTGGQRFPATEWHRLLQEEEMTLDVQKQILIEQRIQNDVKSPVVAYLLLIFLGMFGAHRFYLGKTGTAITMLILTILGIATAILAVGFVLLLAVGIWTFVDIFLIPGMIREEKEQMRQRLTMDAIHGAPVAGS